MNRIVLDTNILLRLSVPEDSSHALVMDSVELLRRNGRHSVLFPQVIYEFWSVATRSIAANGLGMTAEESDALIDQFTRRFPLLRDERGVYDQWRKFAKDYRVTGVNSHDMRIVAAMSRHKVPSLLTTNASDFHRYDVIEVLTPESVLAISDRE